MGVAGVGTGAGAGVGVALWLDPFNFTLWASGASEALEAVDTGERARSSSIIARAAGVGEGDLRDDPASRSPFDRVGVCGSEASAAGVALFAALCARRAAAAPFFFEAGVRAPSTSFCLTPEWKSGSGLYSTGRGLRCLCQNLPHVPHCDLSPNGPFLRPTAILSGQPQFEQCHTPSI